MLRPSRIAFDSIGDGVFVDNILIWDGDTWESGDITDLTAIVEDGTATGQMLFWKTDFTLGSKWKHTDVTELYWSETNRRLGILNYLPTSELDVTGTVTVTRLLAGGVHE